MKIRPAELTAEPIILEEALSPDILELNEKSIKAEEPITVEVTAQSDEKHILIRGFLKTNLKVECGRCCAWIDWPIEVSDFVVEFELPQPLVVDLTPHIREDIILHLPFTAACRLDAEYRCPLSGKVYPPVSPKPVSITGQEVWQELDKLKIKE